jgi:RimJ/RimL family protein N-acetyltransferase
MLADLDQIESPPELSGGRLLLRAYLPDDAPVIAAMCRDPEAQRWLPLPAPYALADAEEWIADQPRKWREEHWANWVASDAASGELLGTCGVRVEPRTESGDLGYLVRPEMRRRGVATGAVAIVVAWCFDELGLGRLQLRCDPRNEASHRTILRCGFRPEGVLRAENIVHGERVDSFVASLLPGDARRA